MTCERVRQLLSDYLDGELSSAVKTRVQSHLYGCCACEREHQALRRTVQLLATQGRQRIPVDCRDLVLARLREEPVAPSRGDWWRAFLPEITLPVPGPSLARATAMAGVAILALGGTWFLQRDNAAPEGPSMLAMSESRQAAPVRTVGQMLTTEEELNRFHAPTSIGQAMGRDNGIILVSDWVDAP